MSEDLEQALLAARQRFEASGFADGDARAEVLAAEGRLAAAQGHQWAEVIDLGVQWSGGAPLPHLLSNSSTAVVVCLAAQHDPTWDGTTVTVVSPADSEPTQLLRLTFDRCYSVKFGGPNDEALHGHPLDGRGLSIYAAHTVHRSEWVERERRINSVHSSHSDRMFDELTHYILSFHDETLEVLAVALTVETVRSTITDLLVDTARRLSQV